MNSRNRTPSVYIGYALHFYFSGLSLRRTAAMVDYGLLVLSSEITFPYGSGFKSSTTKDIIKENKCFRFYNR
jgi:hypothetical protein